MDLCAEGFSIKWWLMLRLVFLGWSNTVTKHSFSQLRSRIVIGYGSQGPQIL